MLRRLLPAALLVVVACAVALALALQRRGPAGPGGRAARPRPPLLRRPATAPPAARSSRCATGATAPTPTTAAATAAGRAATSAGAAVQVPYSPNATAYSGAAGRRAYDGSVGWFAREIEAPVAGRYALRFESAHHRATVFVDGERGARARRRLRAVHRARGRCSRGRHTVAVRVDWRGPRRQADSGWARAWFNYGGLNRPVTLMRLGPQRARRADGPHAAGRAAARRARVDDRRARAQPRRRADACACAASSRAAGARSRTLDFGPAGVGARHVARADGDVDDRRARGCGRRRRPTLYDLRIVVPGEATLRRRIGLREIAWDGGAPAAQRRAARAARRRAAARRARPRRRAAPPPTRSGSSPACAPPGANATRSQLPLSESMLARLDAAGHPRLAGDRAVGAGRALARRDAARRSPRRATARCASPRPARRTRRSSRGR